MWGCFTIILSPPNNFIMINTSSTSSATCACSSVYIWCSFTAWMVGWLVSGFSPHDGWVGKVYQFVVVYEFDETGVAHGFSNSLTRSFARSLIHLSALYIYVCIYPPVHQLCSSPYVISSTSSSSHGLQRHVRIIAYATSLTRCGLGDLWACKSVHYNV